MLEGGLAPAPRPPSTATPRPGSRRWPRAGLGSPVPPTAETDPTTASGFAVECWVHGECAGRGRAEQEDHRAAAATAPDVLASLSRDPTPEFPNPSGGSKSLRCSGIVPDLPEVLRTLQKSFRDPSESFGIRTSDSAKIVGTSESVPDAPKIVRTSGKVRMLRKIVPGTFRKRSARNRSPEEQIRSGDLRKSVSDAPEDVSEPPESVSGPLRKTFRDSESVSEAPESFRTSERLPDLRASPKGEGYSLGEAARAPG